MNKTLGISAVVAAVVAIVVALTFSPRIDVDAIVAQVKAQVANLGAIPGNSVDGREFSVGGITYIHAKTSIIASSSVPCYFPPSVLGNSTTTLLSASMSPVSSGFVGTVTFDLSTTTGVGGYATSAPALAYGVPILGTPTTPFVWALASTTNARTIGTLVGAAYDGEASGAFVRPGEGITFRIATGTPRTFATYLSGSCDVVLKKLN